MLKNHKMPYCGGETFCHVGKRVYFCSRFRLKINN